MGVNEDQPECFSTACAYFQILSLKSYHSIWGPGIGCRFPESINCSFVGRMSQFKRKCTSSWSNFSDSRSVRDLTQKLKAPLVR